MVRYGVMLTRSCYDKDFNDVGKEEFLATYRGSKTRSSCPRLYETPGMAKAKFPKGRVVKVTLTIEEME